MSDLLPTWYQQAQTRQIDFIVLLYEKAEGFVFCPTNLTQPCRIGGDYDGSYPCNATTALSYYDNSFNPNFNDRVEWFIPFLTKIKSGIDFSLDDLQLSQHPKIRLITGNWPW